MSQFIKVTGKDPFYPSLNIPQYLAIASIRRIYPIFGIKGRHNLYHRAPPVDEEAKFISFGIVDKNGETYTCHDLAELSKLGVELPQSGDNFPNDSAFEGSRSALPGKG